MKFARSAAMVYRPTAKPTFALTNAPFAQSAPAKCRTFVRIVAANWSKDRKEEVLIDLKTTDKINNEISCALEIVCSDFCLFG